MSVLPAASPARKRNDASRRTSASAAANLDTMPGTATTQEDGSLMETATTRENSQTTVTINLATTMPLPMKLIPEKKKLIPEKALKREYPQPIGLRMLPPTSPPMPRLLIPPLPLMTLHLNLKLDMTPTQNHLCILLRRAVTLKTHQTVIQMKSTSFLNQGPAQI